jgi:hypothetical protein
MSIRLRRLNPTVAIAFFLGGSLFAIGAWVANVDVANWGTFGGALCFALGGTLQGFERPSRTAGSPA